MSFSILIPHESAGNLYIKELAKAYERCGARVVLGRENFLYLSTPFDVVHIHWPEQLYRVPYEAGDHVAKVRYALEQLRGLIHSGGKCVFTMHNLQPHEGGDTKAARMMYEGVLDAAHVVVHHCNKSAELASSLYSSNGDQKVLVFPHGHYFGYPMGISRYEARAKLGIPQDAFVFLHFGSIQGYKGLDQVLAAFRGLKAKSKHLLVAGGIRSWNQFKTRLRLKSYKLWSRLTGNVTWHLSRVPNDEVQVFLEAADAVVLGHTTGLNSGVAVLGMTFRKAVIGPDVGCIGQVLREGENIVYDSGDVGALREAMAKALRMDLFAAGEKNQSVAHTWSWNKMARGIIDALL